MCFDFLNSNQFQEFRTVYYLCLKNDDLRTIIYYYLVGWNCNSEDIDIKAKGRKMLKDVRDNYSGEDIDFFS